MNVQWYCIMKVIITIALSIMKNVWRLQGTAQFTFVEWSQMYKIIFVVGRLLICKRYKLLGILKFINTKLIVDYKYTS